MSEEGARTPPGGALMLPYRNRLPLGSRILRLAWGVAWALLYRPSPRLLHGWRRFLLRLFGAKVAPTAHPYPRCRIFAPWNLTMGDYSCLADDVDCYSVASISLGAHSVVSQHAHLCGATHDFESPEFTLLPRPIAIGAYAWVAAGAFIGPGVTVGDGAVVGARAVVAKDVEPQAVVAGNPARLIRYRRSPGSPKERI